MIRISRGGWNRSLELKHSGARPATLWTTLALDIYNPYSTATSTLYTPIITLTATIATTSITELLLHNIISFIQPPIHDNSNIKRHKNPIYTQTILIHLDLFSFSFAICIPGLLGASLNAASRMTNLLLEEEKMRGRRQRDGCTYSQIS